VSSITPFLPAIRTSLVGLILLNAVNSAPPVPHNELADPLSRVRLPTRVHRGEAFVDMFMTV
jgi:hypothetical protein